MTFREFVSKQEPPTPRTDFAGFVIVVAVTFILMPVWVPFVTYQIAWVARYGVEAAKKKMEDEGWQ